MKQGGFMIGAIAGDIIGSAYEFHYTKNPLFDLFLPSSTFTDDTVLTVAVADCILHGKNYRETFVEYGHRYPRCGYGVMFRKWLGSRSHEPYNSYGNGSAMRVSPIGFAFSTLDDTLEEASKSASVTHNHPEGIKGAQVVASAIFLARTGEGKDTIKKYIEQQFKYDLRSSVDEIRQDYRFDETCQGSVPEAIIAFLESTDYEDAVRKAVSLGGDSDTQACIAGGIAQAYYREIPTFVLEQTRNRLDGDLLEIIDQFNTKYDLDMSN
jgi:ADP-ribosylglycohydrolase